MTTANEFRRALIQVSAVEDLRPAPKPGADAYGKLKNKALIELVEAEWLRGQAAEMGIGVRPRQVARELARLKKQAFKNGAQYRHFLKEAHFTRRDVTERVELQIFSERIQERILAGLHGKAAKQKALSRFVSEFEERWRARTTCAPGYVTELCSNGPEPKGS